MYVWWNFCAKRPYNWQKLIRLIRGVGLISFLSSHVLAIPLFTQLDWEKEGFLTHSFRGKALLYTGSCIIKSDCLLVHLAQYCRMAVALQESFLAQLGDVRNWTCGFLCVNQIPLPLRFSSCQVLRMPTMGWKQKPNAPEECGGGGDDYPETFLIVGEQMFNKH